MFALLSSFIGNISDIVPPGLLLTLLVVPISNFKYLNIYKNEFIGTLLMIGLTFSPGKWIFADSLYLAWIAHSIGVVAADKLGGGQNVNPAMSVAMWSLGKCDYTEMYVRIVGAMGGGLVAFPLFKALTDVLGWTALGGPEFHPEKGDEDGSVAARSEFFATMLLGFLVYVVNWELNFGKYHYWIKQALTSWGIRALIETFPTAGPAMNPMLGTCWAVFASGGIPRDFRHYFVYWVASIMGVLVSAFLYAVYDGCKFFGRTLPIGPIHGRKKVSSEKKES